MQDNVPKKITVNFQGQQVPIEVHPFDADAPFVVYLPGEDGRIILHLDKGENGEEVWRENGAQTERARELGELIEISDDEDEERLCQRCQIDTNRQLNDTF